MFSAEDAADGVYDYFTANLATQLSAIETARSVSVPRWKSMDTAFIRSRQYPAIEIHITAVSPEYVYETRDEHFNMYNAQVLIAHRGTDYKTIQYHLYRYDEAIERCVATDETFGSVFEYVRMGEGEFAAIQEAQQDRDLIFVLERNLILRVLAG